MATSKTIAALLGPTLIASAASIFLNLDAWPGMVDQAFHNPALIFVSGYPLFVAGLAIVYFHNRWKGGWPVPRVETSFARFPSCRRHPASLTQHRCDKVRPNRGPCNVLLPVGTQVGMSAPG